MSDDLDLGGIDQRHEPDADFRLTLQRRIEAIVAGDASGTSTDTPDIETIGLEPTRPQDTPRWRPGRRILAVASAAAVIAALAVVTSRDDETDPGDTDPPLVASSSLNGWVAFAGVEPTGDSDLYLVREGSSARRIAGSDTDAVDEVCPAFSPDGRRLIFGQQAGNEDDGYHGTAELVITDLSADGALSGTDTIVVQGGTAPPCGIWSPDGRWVALGVDTSDPGSMGAGAADEVWVVDTEEDDIRRLSELAVSDLEWTPDGAQIAIASSGEMLMYSLIIDETRQLGEVAGVHSFTWSPDGQSIVFARLRAGSADRHDLWLMNADGTGERILAENYQTFQGRGPVWSPDGTHIAYQRICTSSPMYRGGVCREEHEIVLVSVGDNSSGLAAGTEVVIPVPETSGPEGRMWWFPSCATWSPDGTALLYVGDSAWVSDSPAGGYGTGIVAVPVDGSTPIVLYTTPRAEPATTVSTDSPSPSAASPDCGSWPNQMWARQHGD